MLRQWKLYNVKELLNGINQVKHSNKKKKKGKGQSREGQSFRKCEMFWLRDRGENGDANK